MIYGDYPFKAKNDIDLIRVIEKKKICYEKVDIS